MRNTYDLPKDYLKKVEAAKSLPGIPFIRFMLESQDYLLEKQMAGKQRNLSVQRHTMTMPTLFRTSQFSDMVVFLFIDLFGLFGYYKEKHQFELYGPHLRANAAAHAFEFFCEEASAHKNEYSSACREILLERLKEAYPIHCKQAKAKVDPAALNAPSVNAFLLAAPEYKTDANEFLKYNLEIEMTDWLKMIRISTKLFRPTTKEGTEMLRTSRKLNLPLWPREERTIETMPTVQQDPDLFSELDSPEELIAVFRQQLPSTMPLGGLDGKPVLAQKKPHNLPDYLVRQKPCCI